MNHFSTRIWFAGASNFFTCIELVTGPTSTRCPHRRPVALSGAQDRHRADGAQRRSSLGMANRTNEALTASSLAANNKKAR
ncbi:hypothetical protein COLSTE_02362 [Collinsella stercoris DSM 13279]|uniref:Uncharacterized protein n=1 Tax=Collinsella stercoris DSM 13279 TaxID=445975 RepID=B6GE25_9ACTN|nr:hypothetical protein COLSTE_02362 [Collinsella stercoris DSM 13279]